MVGQITSTFLAAVVILWDVHQDDKKALALKLKRGPNLYGYSLY